MRDQDDRREQGWQDYPRQGRGGQSDNARETYGRSGEQRTWEPPYDDERTYGRQGQRGGSRFSDDEPEPGGPGRYPRGGGSYGQSDYSGSAQRSSHREGYRYGDSGEAGQGSSRERGAGGQGGHSGYGSSGQGSFGPGGFARGGYGASGYGGDYGQDVHGGGEQDRRPGREGVYGEGAGRTGDQPHQGQAADADLDKDKDRTGGGKG